jgi:hypothetical protein
MFDSVEDDEDGDGSPIQRGIKRPRQGRPLYNRSAASRQHRDSGGRLAKTGGSSAELDGIAQARRICKLMRRAEAEQSQDYNPEVKRDADATLDILLGRESRANVQRQQRDCRAIAERIAKNLVSATLELLGPNDMSNRDVTKRFEQLSSKRGGSNSAVVVNAIRASRTAREDLAEMDARIMEFHQSISRTCPNTEIVNDWHRADEILSNRAACDEDDDGSYKHGKGPARFRVMPSSSLLDGKRVMTGKPRNDDSAPEVSASMQRTSLMAKRLYRLHQESAYTAFKAFKMEYSLCPTVALADDIAKLTISIRYSEASICTSTISSSYGRRSEDSFPQFNLRMSMAKATSVGAWMRSIIIDH